MSESPPSNTSENIEYFKKRVLHAFTEIYARYGAPAGVRSVSNFLGAEYGSKLDRAIKSLVMDGSLVVSAPGVWLPKNATVEDKKAPHRKLSIRKEIVQKEVRRLSHEARCMTPDAFVTYVLRWCADMESTLG